MPNLDLITLTEFRAQHDAAFAKARRLIADVTGPGSLFPSIVDADHRDDLLAMSLQDDPGLLLKIAAESDEDTRASLQLALMALTATVADLFDNGNRETLRREVYLLKCQLTKTTPLPPIPPGGEGDQWWRFYGGYNYDHAALRRELFRLRSQIKEHERAARAAKRAAKAAEGGEAA